MIITECATVLDVIIFVFVVKPSAFHSLRSIPLISATFEIKNTALREIAEGKSEKMTRTRERNAGEVRGRTGREKRRRKRGRK